MSTLQAVPTEEPALSEQTELARKCLYYMTMMREMEDRIERKLYRQGKIVGGVYVGRGQEAIPVGTSLHARPDDVLFPSHRDMAVFLIRGVTPGEIFAQYMGREGGLTRGRDGNMHMGDLSRNLIAIISALAATVPVAAGAAMALKYRGIKGAAAFSYFGDGATNIQGIGSRLRRRERRRRRQFGCGRRWRWCGRPLRCRLRQPGQARIKPRNGVVQLVGEAAGHGCSRRR